MRGGSKLGPKLATYCGRNRSVTEITFNGPLHVTFRADGSQSGGGFSAQVQGKRCSLDAWNLSARSMEIQIFKHSIEAEKNVLFIYFTTYLSLYIYGNIVCNLGSGSAPLDWPCLLRMWVPPLQACGTVCLMDLV